MRGFRWTNKRACPAVPDRRENCFPSAVDEGLELFHQVVFDEIALHVTRPVRWDSDHVVLFDDETKEIAREVVRCGLNRVYIALDYFDASINRIAAWVNGYRNAQKALLYALLQPVEEEKKLQDDQQFAKLMTVQESLKTMPFGDVWDEYCRSCGKPLDDEWYDEVERYEREVLSRRG